MLKDAAEKSEQLELDDHATQNFGRCLAGLAMNVIENPVQSGFFREFLPSLPEKVRGSLALAMGEALEATQGKKAEETWTKWLKEYLELRLIGVPVALSIEETRAMAHWCLYLGSAFPEAVQCIVRMPLKGLSAYRITDKLATDSASQNYPREACRYINAVLKGDEHGGGHPKLATLRAQFSQTIRGTPEMREFEELLYSRGFKT